ncbi:MAG TPA: DciA family protein [Mycobacteriales bacterium]|nr:DciA family protein [Mycobacteriales bacterium]
MSHETGEVPGAGGADAPPVDSAVEDVDDGMGRTALDIARAASRRSAPGARRVAGRRRAGAEERRGGYSGAGPDPRDPQPFGSLVKRLVDDRGWQATAASATVLAGWDRIVGAELAARCQPVSLRGGELTLAAESTAWAMQLRGMLPTLMTRIRAELGPDVVTRIRIHGPTAPTWGSGPRRVAGRGPRDTYG